MRAYKTDKLKNLAIVAHGGAGKTSLTEVILYDAGMTNRLGKVEEGTTVTDYDPEEIKRHISISAALAPCEWKDHKINFIDTPGYFDFVGEVKGSMRVVDSALVVIDAVGGVEVGTELVWRYADEYKLARLIFVNKLERESADFYRVVEEARQKFGNKVIPFQLPIGSEDKFQGIVDLVEQKAYVFTGKGGKEFKEEAIPGDLLDNVETYRFMLMEAAAEADDELMMKYLEGETLTDEEIKAGLRSGVMSGKIVPVLCGSAFRNIGIIQLLDTIVDYLPSPADLPEIKGVHPATKAEVTRKSEDSQPLAALVFKTMVDPFVGRLTFFRVYSGTMQSDAHVYNANKDQTERLGQIFYLRGKQQESTTQVVAGDIAVVAKLQVTGTGDTLCAKENPIILEPAEFPNPTLTAAVEPKNKGDEEKISAGLSKFMDEDPTFKIYKDNETKQTIVAGMGELHLEVINARLQKKFGVEAVLAKPKIPYRETIRGTAKVEGKHKKQSGGHGQYGHVWLQLEPTEPGKNFEFVDDIFGGAVPKQYIPAVEKGVREAMAEGILAGYPVVDVKVTLYDGSYHTVDSSEMAFKIAAAQAFKKGALQARPVLLEPIMNVEVSVPDQYMGDIIGDLNKRRGKILGMEPQGNIQVVKAMVPLAEMYNYAVDLRSITQGRGSYTMEFAHYEDVPAHLTEQIIEEAKKAKAEEAEK